MKVGDRLLRADNLAKAQERYEQAVQADRASAGPRIRLAQVELRRGKYVEAARHIRAAMAAEPNWLSSAPDVRAIHGEPEILDGLLAKLESHVQARPEDRDAWLVLGVEKLLSGRMNEARDVFLRLADRRPDATLQALLDATAKKPQDP
jgi:lipopolysaccharide biosynthesis regulator YciM